MKKKTKLTIEEQINDLKEKGVKFNIVNEEDAKDFLQYNNYYFKLKSYARNYAINRIDGKYVNLEFAYLVELSKIDMYIRKIIIDLSLDIEHFLKTRMIYDMSENPEEDGYNIVELYLEYHPEGEREVFKSNIPDAANSNLLEKHSDGEKYSLWNIVEVLSFGKFIDLYATYYQTYNQKNYISYLGSIKFLRNAAAHNNCLINSLMTPYKLKKFKKTKQLTNSLAKAKEVSRYVSSSARNKKMGNPVIHDFVALLLVYNDLLDTDSNKVARDKKMEQIYNFFCSDNGRCKRNKEYFKKNQAICETHRFVECIIKYIIKENKSENHKHYLE